MPGRENKDLAYASLKTKLEQELEWPSVYMFKFIYASKDELQAEIEKLFHGEIKISKRASSTGKYYSLSVRTLMGDPDEVIQVYRAAESIKGVMVL